MIPLNDSWKVRALQRIEARAKHMLNAIAANPLGKLEANLQRKSVLCRLGSHEAFGSCAQWSARRRSNDQGYYSDSSDDVLPPTP
jgi:hypothetical protein